MDIKVHKKKVLLASFLLRMATSVYMIWLSQKFMDIPAAIFLEIYLMIFASVKLKNKKFQRKLKILAVFIFFTIFISAGYGEIESEIHKITETKKVEQRIYLDRSALKKAEKFVDVLQKQKQQGNTTINANKNWDVLDQLKNEVKKITRLSWQW